MNLIGLGSTQSFKLGTSWPLYEQVMNTLRGLNPPFTYSFVIRVFQTSLKSETTLYHDLFNLIRFFFFFFLWHGLGVLIFFLFGFYLFSVWIYIFHDYGLKIIFFFFFFFYPLSENMYPIRSSKIWIVVLMLGVLFLWTI